MLPFTTEVYVRLLAEYNLATKPAYVLAPVFCIVMLLSIGLRYRIADRVVPLGLAAFWLWTGIAFHYFFFATINFIAPVFTVLFVLQGMLLVWTGTIRGGLAFRPADVPRSWIGVCVVLLTWIIYKEVADMLGRAWPGSAEVGVAPSPTTAVTLGFLLLAQPRAPWHLLVIPLLWCVIGTAYGWFLGIYEDLALLPAALIFLILRGADRKANHRGTENTEVHREE